MKNPYILHTRPECSKAHPLFPLLVQSKGSGDGSRPSRHRTHSYWDLYRTNRDPKPTYSETTWRQNNPPLCVIDSTSPSATFLHVCMYMEWTYTHSSTAAAVGDDYIRKYKNIVEFYRSERHSIPKLQLSCISGQKGVAVTLKPEVQQQRV